MIVLKFGGTSVRDSEWIDKALNIANSQLKNGAVLVSSAMGKTTDKLQEIADLAGAGNKDKAKKIAEIIKNQFITTVDNFENPHNYKECKSIIESIFTELNSIITGLSLLKERTNRSNDLILSFGERLSTLIISSRAKQLGMSTELLDSREFIKTDNNFGQAALLEELTYKLINEKIKVKNNILYIVQGFVGSTLHGITTTLGRGGSDFTATIIGSALKAEEVQIWTDVNGIMTSDPNLVSKAATIPSISYREAAELAYFGATVIHPSTIQPAISRGIPVYVKNTGQPQNVGTKIISDIPSEGPKAIAFKKGITVINISSGRMLLAYGFLKRIFEIFDKFKTSVDLVATSEVSVSITIEDTLNLDNITGELKKIGTVNIEQEKSVICLVGQDLWKDSKFITEVFSTLKSIPIRMISLGSSDTNLSLVVPEGLVENAVKRLHKVFFE